MVFKKFQKLKYTSRSYVSVKLTYRAHYWKYMHDVCVFIFGTFLKPTTQLQTTSSRRLLNGFWWFLVQRKLRVCLFCFCCFQHTFAESKTTKSFSEVKSVVFSLSSFQSCRQTSMCVCCTFLHELYEKSSQYRNVIKEIWNTSVDVYTHQISSPSEHYKHIQAEKNKKPRNQVTYAGTSTLNYQSVCYET